VAQAGGRNTSQHYAAYGGKRLRLLNLTLLRALEREEGLGLEREVEKA
jgi:hypothetical protein